ncbi:MAG: hypothetical protein ACT4NJ_07940 [Nitrosopumilaceae archaeon]
MGKAKFSVVGIIVLGTILLSVSASAQNSIIPDWVKNNAKWWSEGTISEDDYISSLQYLISQRIIKLPIKEVIATDTPVSDEGFAHSFVVRIFFDEAEYSFYSFAKIIEYGQTVGSTKPQLQLESIPSKDKARFYKLTEQIFSKAPDVAPFNIEIDIIAGDGSVIETLQYKNCDLTGYWVYVNTLEDEYRFGKSDKPELREVSDFKCGDYGVKIKS